MQRTTNDKQPRHLVVALVDPAVRSEWGGFVSENHTIVLTGKDKRLLELAVRLLNTAAVDQRYRRVSGTASVAVTLLRQLDLPTPAAFGAALAVGSTGMAHATRSTWNTRLRRAASGSAQPIRPTWRSRSSTR